MKIKKELFIINLIMQSTNYILPHQRQSWKSVAKHLSSIIEANTLQHVFQEMHHINKRNQWNIKTFANCKPEAQILNLLKFAAKCCLEVQQLFKDELPISFPISQPQGMTHTVLTKRQCLCLVANMFFATTFVQPQKQKLPIYFDFTRLNPRPNQIVKVTMNYFERCTRMNNLDHESIIFFRIAQTLPFNSWLQCTEPLCEVRFHPKGSIQDLQLSIQIDFANKSIGGFFLSETYTQEDIIFINNPELMPAVLFHKYMQDNQCILMVGAERFSTYTGYLETYEYAGNFNDSRKTIKINVTQNQKVVVKDSWISAIDAIPYFITSEFNPQNLNRELNKAYVGFHVWNLDQGAKSISTGNWGSGAFNGNLEYKFLIQWLAASRAKRSIDYFSFENERAAGIPQIVKKYEKFSVKQLMQVLLDNAERFNLTKSVFKTLKNSTKSDVFNDQQLDLKGLMQKKLEE